MPRSAPSKIGGDFNAQHHRRRDQRGDRRQNLAPADDHLIGSPLTSISHIASVIVGGKAVGTASSTDHFGIIAANIDFVKIGATTEPLTAGGPDVIELLPTSTNDVTIREL